MILLALILIAPFPLAHAQYSIPVNGRFASLTIGVGIPPSPKWAHDTVLYAALTWNSAENLYHQHFGMGPRYAFVESPDGHVAVTFTKLPANYEGLTWYTYSRLSASSRTGGIIVAAKVQLSSTLFALNQAGNRTDQRLAFLVALRELGHVLGLGEVLNGPDLMNIYVDTNQGEVSTLDLYAVSYLAALPWNTLPPAFITLPSNIPYGTVTASKPEA